LPLGEDRQLAGHLIVELPDGSMHRITGAEMTAWNEALSGFVRRWRLPNQDEQVS
jgi:phage baseplate assembly protein gpV